MIWLQSHEKYDLIAEYDLKKRAMNICSKGALSNLPEKMDGFFSEVRDAILVLYKDNNRLYFCVNEHEFLLDSVTEVLISGHWEQRCLTVLHKGNIIFKIIYSPLDQKPIPEDPTAFAEEEDFDFGLFVSHISKSPKRKEVLLGKG